MSITKLGDDLMKVPKLDASGTNWVIYKDRFLWAVDARGLLHHINGSEEEPQKPSGTQRKVVGEDSRSESIIEVPADKTLLVDWQDKMKMWRQGKAVVKQQIAATISNSLFMKV